MLKTFVINILGGNLVDTICKFIFTSRMCHNVCMSSQIIRLLLRLLSVYVVSPYMLDFSSLLIPSFKTCLSCPFFFSWYFFPSSAIFDAMKCYVNVNLSNLNNYYVVDEISLSRCVKSTKAYCKNIFIYWAYKLS